jgi:IclR family acetate operon transcriptional repressor
MASLGVYSLDRALLLLEEVVSDDGASTTAQIADRLGIARSSARRMVAELERRDLVMRIGRGRYAGGRQLSSLASRTSRHRRLVEVSRPLLRALAQREGWTGHLGIYADEMVTYIVKEGEQGLFTREGAQLEAYCTGIGKALLAQLPEDQFELYLQGSFVSLTPQTITTAEALRHEVRCTRDRGFARDDREMSEAVCCVAVPIVLPDGPLGAVSLSGDAALFPIDRSAALIRRLEGVASSITQKLAKMIERDLRVMTRSVQTGRDRRQTE